MRRFASRANHLKSQKVPDNPALQHCIGVMRDAIAGKYRAVPGVLMQVSWHADRRAAPGSGRSWWRCSRCSRRRGLSVSCRVDAGGGGAGADTAFELIGRFQHGSATGRTRRRFDALIVEAQKIRHDIRRRRSPAGPLLHCVSEEFSTTAITLHGHLRERDLQGRSLMKPHGTVRPGRDVD